MQLLNQSLISSPLLAYPDMYGPESIRLSIRGRPLRLHLLSTGAVAVKRRYQESRTTGLPAWLDFVMDSHFTPWLPIWVLVIEHPDGIFLIDTGAYSGVMQKDYFTSSGVLARWFDTSQFRFEVNREEEIDQQLLLLGISTDQVKTIVLTHLHFDHMDGLRHFPGTMVLINRMEWERPYGALKKLWPEGFNPVPVNLDCPYEMFERTYALTGMEDLLLIHTPGHSYGHSSVLIKSDAGHILFAGDVCYSQEQILSNKYAGANASWRQTQDTYERIRAFARQQPLVFLPSHDPDSALRLRNWEPLIISPQTVSPAQPKRI
jgi:N-acyl homoserine lactone hydrolase